MLFNIQALRALAAGLVVVVHLAALLVAAGWPVTPALIGHSGVDLFFVLSGFLMVHTTTVKPVPAGAFLLNRVVRVVPLYWLCTLAVSAIGLARPELLGGTQVTAANLARSLLFIPYVRPGGFVEPLLFLGWTLNYEMFFYGLFAAALLLARGQGLWAALAIVGLVAAGAVWTPGSVAARFYTNPIMLEFALGMGLAALLGLRRALSPAVAWAAMLFGLAVLFGRFLVIPLAERAWWSGIPATLILAGTVSLERHGTAWRGRGIQLLGAASYALYLVHPFVAQALAKPMLVRFAGQPGLLGAGIAVIVVAVAIAAVAVHWFIERPLTARLRRLLHRTPSVVELEERRIEPQAMAEPVAGRTGGGMA